MAMPVPFLLKAGVLPAMVSLYLKTVGETEYYIVAGVFTYYITKLKPDMISLAETPKLVNFSTHTFGPCGDGKTDDKPFLHKNGDTYYLSWGCFCEL